MTSSNTRNNKSPEGNKKKELKWQLKSSNLNKRPFTQQAKATQLEHSSKKMSIVYGTTSRDFWVRKGLNLNK